MAANRFDFELVAKDEASATIKELDETIAKMLPNLDKAGKNIQMGGRKSTEGLDDLNARLDKMGALAKNSVQYFGDMVPPLRLVSELSGKYGGAIAKIGLGGAVAYGAGQAIASVAGGMKDAAEDAYKLSVQAKDAGMSVHDLTQVAGSMRILGSDTDKARASVESLSRTLTDSMNDRNSTVTGVLNQIGVSIVKKDDHTADTMATLEKLAEVFPTIGAQKQRTVADALGLTPEMLALLREGVHYKNLLAKSDKLGLTVSDDTVQKLSGLNDALNEISASWEGLKNRTKNGLADKLMSDFTIGGHKILKSGVKDGLEGISDLFQHGDFTGLSHALGFISTADAEKLRRIQGDKALYNSLPRRERGAVDAGFMTDAVKKRYDERYRATDEASQLLQDMNIVTHQVNSGAPPVNTTLFDQPRNNALGLRNHNPVNLRSASNETGKVFAGKSGTFSRFGSDEDGLAAASRQLFLYGDRGKHSLQDVIKTFAPSSENNVDAYIQDVARDSGFKPGENIDLHSPDVLKRLLPAMIKHEQGTQPFSQKEIDTGIHDAIFDPRWSGKRDPDYLMAQRNQPFGYGADDATAGPRRREESVPDYLQARRSQAQANEQTGIIPPDQTAELTKALREIVAKADKDGKTQLEVTLTSANGEQKRVQVPFGARVTTSMTS